METRGVVAEWNAITNQLNVWTSTQAVHHVQAHVAAALGLNLDQVRVVCADVGGAFGAKEHLYPDEVLVCAAAMRCGAPVKWIEDRYEHFTATLHARGQIHEAQLALDGTGKFLALWSDIVVDLGAHPSNVGAGPAHVTSLMLQGPYEFERVGTRVRGVLTNCTPTGAYRGFGMQEASWVRERLVEEAARELRIDPVDLRLRNMIPSERMPFKTRVGPLYDSGNYRHALEETRLLVKASPVVPTDDRRRGVGYASYVESTGLGPSAALSAAGFHVNGYEASRIVMDGDANVTVYTGGALIGQGLDTGLAQIAAEHLGISIDNVRIVSGDTDRAPYSEAGSIASRAMVVAGGALFLSSQKLKSKLCALAAHRLEADPDDIELAEGVARVSGVPASAIELSELARDARLGRALPDGIAPGLDEAATYAPENVTYSYATHAAAVAVDIETGLVEIEGYWVVHDSGVVVNPMIADGQVQGGVAQGIGIALYEEMQYGPDAQPGVSSFMDYLLPLTSGVPDVVIRHHETSSPYTPGGMKGLGEGGVIPAPAAIGNAICAAVPEIASFITSTPMSPTVLWAHMRHCNVT